MTSVDANTAKREKRADHAYVDAAGKAVDDQEVATGVSYTDKATKKSIVFQVPGAGFRVLTHGVGCRVLGAGFRVLMRMLMHVRMRVRIAVLRAACRARSWKPGARSFARAFVHNELRRRDPRPQDLLRANLVARDREAAQGSPELVDRQTGVDQGPEHHVAGNARKTVEVQDS